MRTIIKVTPEIKIKYPSSYKMSREWNDMKAYLISD